ncbi:hypothetical protein F2Q70_00021183 [Brassica cretica]|uniref:Uncharacterized protein n=1 Tax=Brassica cretica TaxID=69181 RepID=A0A8S9HLE9_BRACR|nr:hypothetical protein F2Q70_00021183 [Brassica cretica]KAF2558733.1 hypothetical protein F2Q68_00014644 [Brassica cretica]
MCLWCHWCALGADVLGEVLPRSGRLKPRLRGSLAQAISLKWSVKIAAVEDSELRLEKERGYMFEDVWTFSIKKKRELLEDEVFHLRKWKVVLSVFGRLGEQVEDVERRSGHSKALSDGVRCGLSLVASVLAFCVVELAIMCNSCGRLKSRLRGSFAQAVSLNVKIAAVEKSEFR